MTERSTPLPCSTTSTLPLVYVSLRYETSNAAAVRLDTHSGTLRPGLICFPSATLWGCLSRVLSRCCRQFGTTVAWIVPRPSHRRGSIPAAPQHEKDSA
jgi:hypothetical protein